MKADEKVTYEEDGKKVEEKYTEFELLRATVEELKNVVEEHTSILIENSLKRTEEITAPYFDTDKVAEILEEEDKS